MTLQTRDSGNPADPVNSVARTSLLQGLLRRGRQNARRKGDEPCVFQIPGAVAQTCSESETLCWLWCWRSSSPVFWSRPSPRGGDRSLSAPGPAKPRDYLACAARIKRRGALAMRPATPAARACTGTAASRTMMNGRSTFARHAGSRDVRIGRAAAVITMREALLSHDAHRPLLDAAARRLAMLKSKWTHGLQSRRARTSFLCDQVRPRGRELLNFYRAAAQAKVQPAMIVDWIGPGSNAMAFSRRQPAFCLGMTQQDAQTSKSQTRDSTQTDNRYCQDPLCSAELKSKGW